MEGTKLINLFLTLPLTRMVNVFIRDRRLKLVLIEKGLDRTYNLNIDKALELKISENTSSIKIFPKADHPRNEVNNIELQNIESLDILVSKKSFGREGQLFRTNFEEISEKHIVCTSNEFFSMYILKALPNLHTLKIDFGALFDVNFMTLNPYLWLPSLNNLRNLSIKVKFDSLNISLNFLVKLNFPIQTLEKLTVHIEFNSTDLPNQHLSQTLQAINAFIRNQERLKCLNIHWRTVYPIEILPEIYQNLTVLKKIKLIRLSFGTFRPSNSKKMLEKIKNMVILFINEGEDIIIDVAKSEQDWFNSQLIQAMKDGQIERANKIKLVEKSSWATYSFALDWMNK